MDATKIGTFIAAERRAKGWTQRQLAGELQLTDKAVSRWETGKGLPDVSLLLPLAAALGVSVGELLAGERQPQPPAVQAVETRTAEQLVTYTQELGPQLRRRRACTVLAGGLLFAAAFLGLQFLRLVLTSSIGLAAFGAESLLWLVVLPFGFYPVRLLAAASALHGWVGRNTRLPPCVGYGRGGAVVVLRLLCRSVCRVRGVPGTGFLAHPGVARECKSGAVPANRAIPALPGAGAGVHKRRRVCVPRAFCLLDEPFRVFRSGSAAAAHLAPLAWGQSRAVAGRGRRQCDRDYTVVRAHGFRAVPV